MKWKSILLGFVCIIAMVFTASAALESTLPPSVNIPHVVDTGGYNTPNVDYYAPRPCYNCGPTPIPTATPLPVQKATADFTIDPPAPSKGYKKNAVLTFTAYQTGGPELSSDATWRWGFSTSGVRSTTQYGQITSFKFTKSGKWTVALTVSDHTNNISVPFIRKSVSFR